MIRNGGRSMRLRDRVALQFTAALKEAFDQIVYPSHQLRAARHGHRPGLCRQSERRGNHPQDAGRRAEIHHEDRRRQLSAPAPRHACSARAETKVVLWSDFKRAAAVNTNWPLHKTLGARRSQGRVPAPRPVAGRRQSHPPWPVPAAGARGGHSRALGAGRRRRPHLPEDRAACTRRPSSMKPATPTPRPPPAPCRRRPALRPPACATVSSPSIRPISPASAR